MKNQDIIDEAEINMLINHCIERLPNLNQGLVCDCIDELNTTISFESPEYILTFKLERKKEAE